METALRNLLENAVRHTPPGAEILVTVSAAGAVRVSDDGPGVPAEIRDRAFERFSRGDPRGAGAGSWVCRSYARSWSGTAGSHDWRSPSVAHALSWSSGRAAGAISRTPAALVGSRTAT
ncbi:ATP-binding protein [Caulobacter segnis]